MAASFSVVCIIILLSYAGATAVPSRSGGLRYSLADIVQVCGDGESILHAMQYSLIKRQRNLKESGASAPETAAVRVNFVPVSSVARVERLVSWRGSGVRGTAGFGTKVPSMAQWSISYEIRTHRGGAEHILGRVPRHDVGRLCFVYHRTACRHAWRRCICHWILAFGLCEFHAFVVATHHLIALLHACFSGVGVQPA
jgi:hypothetical protein